MNLAARATPWCDLSIEFRCFTTVLLLFYYCFTTVWRLFWASYHSDEQCARLNLLKKEQVKIMNFVFKMMNFVSKIMNFVFKMMRSRALRRARTRATGRLVRIVG